jgi:hypothetical protein
MNCSDNPNNTCSSCISNVVKNILVLQTQDYNNDNYVGCDKPFLGPTCNSICYNTRPIELYNCCTGSPWSFTYTLNNETSTSNVLRIEALDNCCCTCRILYLDSTTNQYVGTREFVTIDLNCCGAIRCLADTYIELC